MGYAIKYFNICTLSGHGPINLVFVIADDSLDAEDLIVIEVVRLSLYVDHTSVGYICFTKTKCGNKKFLKWFAMEILLSYVVKMRAYFHIPSTEPAFISCDREAVQINCFFDDEICTQYDENNIMVGKFPANTTAVTQPNDCYKIFSATKSYLANVPKDAVNLFSSTVTNIVDSIVRVENENNHKFVNKIKIANGITKVTIALTHSMRLQIIKKSFSMAGIKSDCSLDMMQVLTQFNQPLNSNLITNITDNLNYGVERFDVNGIITDAEIDIILNTSTNNDKIRDNKNIVQ